MAEGKRVHPDGPAAGIKIKNLILLRDRKEAGICMIAPRGENIMSRKDKYDETKQRRISRTIHFSRLSENTVASTVDSQRRDKLGRLIVPLYSRFFSTLSDNVMYSNAAFHALYEEIEASLCVYSINEQIVLTVYESSASSDGSMRETVLIGFKKYIHQYLKRKTAMLKHSFFTFLSFALLAILIEYLNYTVFSNALSEWVCNLIDVSATVLIWQFVAYLAFEFSQEKKAIRRLKQISQMEYVFRHWE